MKTLNKFLAYSDRIDPIKHRIRDLSFFQDTGLASPRGPVLHKFMTTSFRGYVELRSSRKIISQMPRKYFVSGSSCSILIHDKDYPFDDRDYPISFVKLDPIVAMRYSRMISRIRNTVSPKTLKLPMQFSIGDSYALLRMFPYILAPFAVWYRTKEAADPKTPLGKYLATVFPYLHLCRQMEIDDPVKFFNHIVYYEVQDKLPHFGK